MSLPFYQIFPNISEIVVDHHWICITTQENTTNSTILTNYPIWKHGYFHAISKHGYFNLTLFFPCWIVMHTFGQQHTFFLLFGLVKCSATCFGKILLRSRLFNISFLFSSWRSIWILDLQRKSKRRFCSICSKKKNH